MLIENNLPELARHEYALDFATGNFSLKVIDYAQTDILENFVVSREYNSRRRQWIFNLKNNSPKLTLKTLREIFFVYEGGNLISVRDELGRVTRYEYAENLLSRVIYPDGSHVKYFYDDAKNLAACEARGNKIIFRNEYDEFGRITKLADDSGERNFFYDAQNRRTIESGRENIIYRWNLHKLITEIIYADKTSEKFHYDAEKNLNYKVARNGDEFFWKYNGGLLTREILPDGTIKNFEYDANSNLTRKIDSDGREEIFRYSSKNLLIEKRTRLNVKDWRREIWTRDIAGRILTHEVNGQITNYAYDGEAPVPALMKTPCGYKFSFFYDKLYRLLTLRTEAGEFSFAHTPLNEIIAAQKNIFAPVEPVEIFPAHSDFEIRDFGGRLIEAREKSGDKFKLTRWKYDLNDNCVERREWRDLQSRESATGRVKIIRYEYDAQNRPIKKLDGETLTKYYYDCLNRLTRQNSARVK